MLDNIDQLQVKMTKNINELI